MTSKGFQVTDCLLDSILRLFGSTLGQILKFLMQIRKGIRILCHFFRKNLPRKNNVKICRSTKILFVNRLTTKYLFGITDQITKFIFIGKDLKDFSGQPIAGKNRLFLNIIRKKKTMMVLHIHHRFSRLIQSIRRFYVLLTNNVFFSQRNIGRTNIIKISATKCGTLIAVINSM